MTRQRRGSDLKPGSVERRDGAAARPERTNPAHAEFVILTGLSGSGKGTVLRVLEDLGFYAVDHLPVDLIPKFIELSRQSPDIRRAAFVVDIREGEALERFPQIYAELRQEAAVVLLFLEADEEVLQRRFSETRRPHPLGAGRVFESIRAEREKLAPIKALADLAIDTSGYNIHDLRRLIHRKFTTPENEPLMLVAVQSFGFKHGVPSDADLLFDVRFLPNPHYLPGGRKLTGKDAKVIEYIRSFPQSDEFVRRVSDLLIYLMPHYASEGKSYLTISFGCTGGRHRSVWIAEEIAKRLEQEGYPAKLDHRDVAKPA